MVIEVNYNLSGFSRIMMVDTEKEGFKDENWNKMSDKDKNEAIMGIIKKDMNKPTLQNALDNKIIETMRDIKREPSVIIMHPKTWNKLIKSISSGMHTPVTSRLTYQKWRVLRSEDVFQGSFIVV